MADNGSISEGIQDLITFDSTSLCVYPREWNNGSHPGLSASTVFKLLYSLNTIQLSFFNTPFLLTQVIPLNSWTFYSLLFCTMFTNYTYQKTLVPIVHAWTVKMIIDCGQKLGLVSRKWDIIFNGSSSMGGFENTKKIRFIFLWIIWKYFAYNINFRSLHILLHYKFICPKVCTDFVTSHDFVCWYFTQVTSQAI